jgi:hypothetical protein
LILSFRLHWQNQLRTRLCLLRWDAH